MKRQKVTFICSPPLLDNAIEQIKVISGKVDLDILIFVSAKNPNSSIFELNQDIYETGIFAFNDCSSRIKYHSHFDEYFTDCKSVRVVFFSNSIIDNIKLYLKIFKLPCFKNNVIHYDDVSGISLIIMIRYFYKSVILNVHDPVPHSGEDSLVKNLIKKIAFLATNNFVVYSKFAQSQFISRFGKNKKLIQLNLIPYNFYTLINKDRTSIKEEKNEIIFLFFGRISQYKGINELLTTFIKISSNHPNIKLIIAGKGRVKFVAKQSSKIVLKNYFIDLQEMTSLFQQADVLVCPYKDATQSGVIMTALAFNLPHIVSNVGALPENSAFPELVYDIEDPLGLEKAILSFLQNSKDYKSKARISRKSDVNLNVLKMIDLYHSLS